MDWFQQGITDIRVLDTRVTKCKYTIGTCCMVLDGVDRSR